MPTYLLRLDQEQLCSVMRALSAPGNIADGRAAAIGDKLRRYLTPHPNGHCADCGNKLKRDGQYVSPESAALTEVVLEGFKAIESVPRTICTACYREAFARVSGPDSVCPI